MGLDQPQKQSHDATALRQRLRKTEEADRERSAESWNKAESALNAALRAQRQKPAGAEASLSRAQTPLPQGQSSESEEDAVEAPPATPGHGNSRATARAGCFGKRARLHRVRAAECAEKSGNHAKRRLRAKIANVLLEVRRRQDLHQAQERSRKFREQKCLQGRGPQTVDLGDATQGALGLVRPTTVEIKDVEDAPPPTSPRRTALLDSLALNELDLLRRSPEFFFSGPAITAAVSPLHPVPARSQSAGLLGSPSSGLTPDSGSSGPARGLASAQSADKEVSASLEDLIEFFSCSRDDRAADIKQYLRNLRAQLVAIANGSANGLLPFSAAQHAKAANIDWRKKLCRSGTAGTIDGRGATSGQKSRLEESTSVSDQLELMPCMGRHPLVREDDVSPTLQKVREVYNRRDVQDARWVEEHREAIACRLALNAFKAKEQQRELLLQVFKQKELHKVRMLEAEVRKSMLDSEARDHAELLRVQKHHRGQRASDRADASIEEKRNHARSTLEAWQNQATKAERHLRREEFKRQIEGARQLEKYMLKLDTLGEAKHNAVTSQTQKNDELKTRIHASLSAQLENQRKDEASICAEVAEAKLEAAAIRRKHAQLGNRYHFVEKAFGEKAVGFDAKHHATVVNRKTPGWKRNAEAWVNHRDTYSMPSMPSPAETGGRPWTPTGMMAFEELIERMDTLAIT